MKKFYNLGAWFAVFGFLNRDAVGWSLLCDSGIFWSYSLVFVGSLYARIQKVFSEGFNFYNAFLVDEGREDHNITISRPSSARQRNAI